MRDGAIIRWVFESVPGVPVLRRGQHNLSLGRFSALSHDLDSRPHRRTAFHVGGFGLRACSLVQFTIWLPLTVALAAALLPPMKGATVGLCWATNLTRQVPSYL